jgi:hypothetical protein
MVGRKGLVKNPKKGIWFCNILKKLPAKNIFMGLGIDTYLGLFSKFCLL